MVACQVEAGLMCCSAVSAAIKDVFNETRCCLEPAGAVAVAGAKAYLQRHGMQVPRTRRLPVISGLTGSCISGHQLSAALSDVPNTPVTEQLLRWQVFSGPVTEESLGA